jgi:multiple sugar transport system ATP-binding protein
LGQTAFSPDSITQLSARVRPEHFEDAATLDDEHRQHGLMFHAEVDVIEWLGSEQYAFVPFEAPEQVRRALSELASELDIEQMRTQLVITLDADTRISEGFDAELWLDPPACSSSTPSQART